MQMNPRGLRRFGLGLPLSVDGVLVGVIHDLSSNGIAFSSPKAYITGTQLALMLEHPTPEGQMVQLRAEATVARSERANGAYTIGARLTEPFQA